MQVVPNIINFLRRHDYSSFSTGPSLRKRSDEVELSLDRRDFLTGSTSSAGDADVGVLVAVGDAGVDCSGDRERKVVGMVIFEGVILVVCEKV